MLFRNNRQEDINENETVETPINCLTRDHMCAIFEESSQSRAQIIERNVADRVRKEAVFVAAAVEHWFHETTLTVMDSVVMPEFK